MVAGPFPSNSMSSMDSSFSSSSSLLSSSQAPATSSSSSSPSLPTILSSEIKAIRKSFLKHIESEPKYLLRKCLQYNWETVLVCCSVLIDEIFPKGAGALAEAGKQQLLATDPWGNNALHAVCYFKPPQSVVVELLAAARCVPDGPIQLHTSLTTKDRRTPLAIACAGGCTIQVMEALLEPQLFCRPYVSSSSFTTEAYGSSEDYHDQQRHLVHAGYTISIPDVSGTTPFLGLVQRYQMLRQLPFNQKSQPCLEDVMSIPDGSCHTDEFHNQHQNGDVSLFASFWTKVDILIQSAWFADCQFRSQHLRESLPSLLHGTAYLSECIPPVLTDLIMRCSPNDSASSSSAEYEQERIVPLHLAIMTDTIRPQSKQNQSLIYQRAYFINKLLEADPSMANCPVPSSGIGVDSSRSDKIMDRMPLFEAVASGLHWHIAMDMQSCWTSSADSTTPDDTAVVEGPLQQIWKCAPHVILEQDPVTGLYPFMLAATIIPEEDYPTTKELPYYTNNDDSESDDDDDESDSESDSDSDNKNNDGISNDTFQLDTIYSLLRLNPEPLMMQF